MSDTALLQKVAGPWKSISGFHEHLASRRWDSWLFPFESTERLRERLSDRYPGYCKTVIAAADAACTGEFNLLGHTVRYPDGMDWHRDPQSEFRWPLLYREQMDSLVWSPNPPADLTLVWELSRHQHFSYLGIAYDLTKDERYAEAFTRHVLSWIEQNPVQLGIHWHSCLEVALRLIAWTAAFQIFQYSVHMTVPFVATFFQSMYRQVDFIRWHLQSEYTSAPNNHLVAELSSLAIIGAIFPEFKEAVIWKKTGIEELARQISLQTHDDGVNKEQATGYHRFVAELLIILVALGRRGLLPRKTILEETLEKMLDYQMYSKTPDGCLPMWGDSSHIRALGMEPYDEHEDARWLLGAGAVLFQRQDWKHIAGSFGVQSYLLLGEEGLASWEWLRGRQPEHSSRDFPDGGMYLLRESWDHESDLAIFRCGPFGLGGPGKCSHAHCDLLSPILWIKGQALLTDPGTYTYSGSWRNSFRLTAAHNTLVVDGQEQADPLVPFSWSRIPQAECVDWVEGERVAGRLLTAHGVNHTREVVHQVSGTWQIIDRLEGRGVHHLAWNFHFALGLTLKWIEPYHEWIVEEGGRPFVVIRFPAIVNVHEKMGWHSRIYGCKEQASWLEGVWQGEITGGRIDFSWEFLKVGYLV